MTRVTYIQFWENVSANYLNDAPLEISRQTWFIHDGPTLYSTNNFSIIGRNTEMKAFIPKFVLYLSFTFIPMKYFII